MLSSTVCKNHHATLKHHKAGFNPQLFALASHLDEAGSAQVAPPGILLGTAKGEPNQMSCQEFHVWSSKLLSKNPVSSRQGLQFGQESQQTAELPLSPASVS
ncbi:UNVERIFIED_CONTAM: hypothetical protein K2H54_015924 [Gekko kuhli]